MSGDVSSATVPYAFTFPPGHAHEGKGAARKTNCSRCKSEFVQHRVNPDYIESIRTHRGEIAAASFKASCEVTPDGKIYQPPFCNSCTRKIRT